MPGSKEALLDKDWGAKIPDYITKGTFSIAVFFMSLTMRGGYPMYISIIHVIVDSADLSPLLKMSNIQTLPSVIFTFFGRGRGLI